MKEKKKSNKFFFGILFIILIIIGTWFILGFMGYHLFMEGSNHRYGNLRVEVKYPYSNLTNDEIIFILQNSGDDIDIINITEYNIEFIFINTTLTNNELNRFATVLKLQSERFDRGVELIILYHSNNDFSKKIYTSQEKLDFEKKVNKMFDIDKIIIDRYLNPLTSFFNNTLDVGYTEIDYRDKYIFEE